MNDYEALDLALEYLNEGKLPDKAAAVKEILKKVAGTIIVAAIVIALLPLVVIILAVVGIGHLNNKQKDKQLEELLKANPELKQALINLAKKNQDIIATKCKDFQKYKIEINRDNLSVENNTLTVSLGSWRPKHPDKDDILKIYVDNFIDMDNYPDYDSKEEYANFLAEIDITETLREFCKDDANEMFEILEKKYHIKKSYDNYLQLVEEIDKTYNATTNSTLLSVKVDHGSNRVSREDESAEICFYGTDAGSCSLVLKWQDYNNIRLPESVKTLVNAEIQKRTK